MGPSGPLLKVGLGPSLELSAAIKWAGAEEEVKDAEAAGEDATDAEAEVADQVSGDAVRGIEETASEFKGLDISDDVADDLFSQLQTDLDGSLEADPLLTAFVPAAADAVPSEVTPGEAAAIDAETGVDAAIEADGTEVLILLFL